MFTVKIPEKDLQIIVSSLFRSMNRGEISAADYMQIRSYFPEPVKETPCHEACQG